MEFIKRSSLSAAILIALTACGGNGGDPATTGDGTKNSQSSKVLKGTAAAGAPIIGTVTVKGSQGKIISQLIEANGDYSIDVSELTAPYMLRASGTVGGRGYTLHSFAEETDVGQTVNITPFTDLIVANAAGQIAREYFEQGDFSALTPEKIDAEETALQKKLQPVLSGLGVAETIDLLHTAFSTDHSQLDAALDVVRVEVDPDNNIATLTNVIDNTTLRDSISDNAQDQSGELQVVSDLNTIEGDMQAITQRFAALTQKFSGGSPSVADLEAFFSTDFTSDDQQRSQFLTDITSDPDLRGLRFENLAIRDLDHNAGTAVVSFQVRTNERELGTIPGWQVKKQGDTWIMRGDQRIAEIATSFQCIHSENDPAGIAYGCDLNIDIRDSNPNNNQGAGQIRSARITLLRNGVPVPGAIIYAGDGNHGSDGAARAGELALYDSDYRDDAITLGSDGLDPALFRDNDVAKIELFSSTLNVTAGIPAVTSDPVATYEVTIPKAPIPMAQVQHHAYPALSQETKTAVQNFSGGDLNISWTYPANAGLRNQEAVYFACDAENDCVNKEQWRPAGTTATFEGIDLAGAGVDKLPILHVVRIYSVDAYGREFSHYYHYNQGGTADTHSGETGNTGASPATPLPVDLTKLGGVTVYEVYFDNEESLGCSAPKSVGKIEFLTNTQGQYLGLSGADAGVSGEFNFTADATHITNENGEVTTFTNAESGQAYFMTGMWVSADKTEQDLNYYFTTEQAASSFVLPGCSQ